MSVSKKIQAAKPGLKRMLDKHNNTELLYYLCNFSAYLIATAYFRSRLNKKLGESKNYDTNYINNRVNYYNNLTEKSAVKGNTTSLSELKLGGSETTYFFDSYKYARYFNDQLKAIFLFGDIIHVPDEPTIVKSRPIQGNNANSVLLNLNKVRHFIFTKDSKDYINKKNMLVWRGNVYQPHRIWFMEMYFNHPLCNIGQVNTDKTPQWIVDRLTIDEHLDYKFILCLEGNDVSSNLKWVMSSNSVAVMPKPSFETWFMEGTLVPDYHYILIKDDFSDLEERLQYFISNTAAAQQIVKNANRHVNQFKDEQREDIISLLVLQKYFYTTGQIEICNDSFSRP